MSGMPHGTGPGPGQAPATAINAPGAPTITISPATQSPQNLNQIVTDYLKKKGFTKTEAVFRKETQNLGPDGRPAHNDTGPEKYLKAFRLIADWVENNIDIYKFELRKLLWPVFVYSYLELLLQEYLDEASHFFATLRPIFEDAHGDNLAEFSTLSMAQHVRENHTARMYRENKYRIPMNPVLATTLFHFLEREADNGGETIVYVLERFCQVDNTARGPLERYSFEAIVRRGQNVDLDEIDAHEGIPGLKIGGILNKDILEAAPPLRLGPLPLEPELRDDVRAELEDEDQRRPPLPGQPTLVDEFDRKIKREESDDGPSRSDLPLPPSRARDVVTEMQKVRENRDRFRIEGRTGGIGVPVSACIFTFHNTLGSVSCMDFSKDHQLVAVGTMDSYIRVYAVDGRPLTSKYPTERGVKVNNRKLIGHSGPVYGVSFSDSIANLDRNIYGDGDANKPDTSPSLLLSCAADGHVRLWSLDYWQCLCVFRAHDGPVFRVLWGPHGHYFASAGWDKTVRVFAQDHASALRIMVGHDTSVSALAWHPNGTYVFSASDETDKTIRMWSIVTGACVRAFTGHAEYISALQCAHNGRVLASADTGGNIVFWDIDKGAMLKRCRGHGKGGIPSLSFSAEDKVLVSGGLDGTVRLWDVELPTDPTRNNPLASQAGAGNLAAAATGVLSGGASQAGDALMTDVAVAAVSSTAGSVPAATVCIANGAALGGVAPTTMSGAVGSGGKKKAKEVQITADQTSAFATKKTPVMKVQFTRMNLVLAGGCYDPER